jgi:hypothetical protein
MSIFDEVPMYSPFSMAKLFKGFTYADKSDFDNQMTNFVHLKSFKWVPERVTEKGTYQPIGALLMNDGKTTIRTNTLAEIEAGDFIELDYPAFKNKYFIVSGPVQIDGMLCPKWRQTFKHIPLATIDFTKPNIKKEPRNVKDNYT